MKIVFFSTSDVFDAEERLRNKNILCEIVPTPVTDKAYCGVCIKTDAAGCISELEGMDYRIVE